MNQRDTGRITVSLGVMKGKGVREKRTVLSLLWSSTLFWEEAVQAAVRTLSKDLVACRWECHQARSLVREVASSAVNLQGMFDARAQGQRGKI